MTTPPSTLIVSQDRQKPQLVIGQEVSVLGQRYIYAGIATDDEYNTVYALLQDSTGHIVSVRVEWVGAK